MKHIHGPCGYLRITERFRWHTYVRQISFRTTCVIRPVLSSKWAELNNVFVYWTSAIFTIGRIVMLQCRNTGIQNDQTTRDLLGVKSFSYCRKLRKVSDAIWISEAKKLSGFFLRNGLGGCETFAGIKMCYLHLTVFCFVTVN